MLTKTLTIPNGSNVSPWLDTKTILGTAKEADNLAVSRLICPDVMTSVTSITFESSYDGSTAKTMRDSLGTALGCAVSAGADVALLVSDQASLPPFIRIKSNVNASADRSFLIGFREV